MEENRPPLGLMPESVHNRLRVSEILQAIWRYTDAGKTVPPDWISELKRRVCF